jgi:putative transposase
MEAQMSWTETTRLQYRRDQLRYASDMTDEEWSVIAPLMPDRSRLGRPRKVDLRVVVNAILYVLATGCQWRALPKDFPPRSTIQGYFYRWRDDRTWGWINRALV